MGENENCFCPCSGDKGFCKFDIDVELRKIKKKESECFKEHVLVEHVLVQSRNVNVSELSYEVKYKNNGGFELTKVAQFYVYCQKLFNRIESILEKGFNPLPEEYEFPVEHPLLAASDCAVRALSILYESGNIPNLSAVNESLYKQGAWDETLNFIHLEDGDLPNFEIFRTEPISQSLKSKLTSECGLKYPFRTGTYLRYLLCFEKDSIQEICANILIECARLKKEYPNSNYIRDVNSQNYGATLIPADMYKLGQLSERLYWKHLHEKAASKTYQMHAKNRKNSGSGNDTKSENSRLRKKYVKKIAVKLKRKDPISAWPAKKLVHEVQVEINALSVSDALKKHLRKNDGHPWEDSTIQKDLSDSGFFKRYF